MPIDTSANQADDLPFPAPECLQHTLGQALSGFKQVSWLAQTGSTNADLIAQARSQTSQQKRPCLLGTHLQTSGRGRAGRSWQNRVGANLMFSCAFDIFLPVRQLTALAPLLGMASCLAIRSLLCPAKRARLTMKWPNDIMWDQAKLAGMLIESSKASTSNAPDHYLIVIGLGLNLHDARSLAQSLQRRISDWAEIRRSGALAKPTSVQDLVGLNANAWLRALEQAGKTGLHNLPRQFVEVDALAGKMIDIHDNGRLLHSGVASGIDPSGRLLLRTQDGIQAVYVGDVSVRLSL